MESPLQLLCTVEAHADGLAGPRTRVLARSDVPTLTVGIDAVQALGLPPGLDVEVAPPPRRLPDGVVVVGDPFSGAFQSALLRAPRPPERIVVVDDGLATLDLARRLLDGAPLVRLTAPPGPLRYAMGTLAARRLRRVVDAGRLTLCTTVPLDDAVRRDAAIAGIVDQQYAGFDDQPLAKEAARKEIGEILEQQVHLFLFVKVRENWGNDPERYREMGLEYPSGKK